MTPCLLIDDDVRLGALLRDYLAKHDLNVTAVTDGEQGLRALSEGVPGPAPRARFEVVLLDLMLPGIDGLEVCRRIRKDPALAGVPVLMLTAKGDDVDKIVGLELGADDYLAKPFNPRELLARVRAVLRRSSRPEAPAPADNHRRLRVGELALDLDARTVSVAGQPRTLTSFEFELLAELMRAAGRVLSRERLLETLKGDEFESFDRSIDVHISKLRAKLEADPKNPRYIKTVRGVGYVCARGGEDGE